MTTQLFRVERASVSAAEANDCAVIAVALVLDLSYETVHTALAAAGRRHGGSTKLYIIEHAVQALGFQVRKYSAARLGVEVGRRRPTVADALERPEAWAHLPNPVLMIPEHAAALVNGKVHDRVRDRRAPIEEAWEFWRPAERVAVGREPPPVVYL